MTATETKRPRQVLSHRRGLVPVHQEGKHLVSQPTAIAPVASVDPVRRPNCPEWCIGHLSADGDRLCMAAFGPWVTPTSGSPVQMYVVKENDGQPTLNLYADPRERYGAKLTADKVRALITDLTEGLHLIDAA